MSFVHTVIPANAGMTTASAILALLFLPDIMMISLICDKESL